MGAVILSIGVARCEQTEHQQKNSYVLMLSSYGYDNDWGTRLAKGIRRHIREYDKGLLVNICYADIGNRSTFMSDRLGMQGAFSSGRINSQLIVPSVLVIIGDEGWMLYRIMNLRGRWGNVPVVLCGVHPTIMKDYSDFYTHHTFVDSMMMPIVSSSSVIKHTGVMLPDNGRSTLEMIRGLIPDFNQVHYITNGGYQDECELSVVRRALSDGYPDVALTVHRRSRNNMDSLSRELAKLSERSVILIRNAANDPKVEVPTFILREYNLKGSTVLGGYTTSINDIAVSAARMVTDLYNGKSISEIPFVYASNAKPRLNMEAVEAFELTDRAEKLSGVVYSNIPEPFCVRHFRSIMVSLLILIILLVLVVLYIRSARYWRKLTDAHKRYKGLYDEYNVVYENMPLGLILFDDKGRMVDTNKAASDFIEQNNIAHDSDLRTVSGLKNPYFKIQQSEIVNEESAEHDTLMVVLDNSEQMREIESKNSVLDKMVFAMDSSGWGVAQYNLLDGKGFASQAWRDNLGLDGSFVFNTAYRNVVAEDQKKIYDFIDRAREGRPNVYVDSIRVNIDGKEHLLRHAMAVMRHAIESNQIIIVQLMINIDEQKVRETELSKTLHKVRESSLLKNAFIANTSDDISVLWTELSQHIDRLMDAATMQERQQIFKDIDNCNVVMLDMLERIINISKEESGKGKNR